WFGQSGAVESLKLYLKGPTPPDDESVGKDVPYDPGAWYRYLRNHWKSDLYKRANPAVGFDQFWEAVLREGVLVDGPVGRCLVGGRRRARRRSAGPAPRA
ncbi:MAG: hypothetical protein ABEN55_22665, partial [Bradymonadaceae bacterium]